MCNRTDNNRTISGFSLVELLVAMTLGLMLLSGMIAVFSGNKRSSEANTAMANIQESARFALNAIAQDARSSGYQGCIDTNRGKVTPQADSAPVVADSLRATAATGALVNTDGSWDPVSPIGYTPSTVFPPIAGTHSLMFQFGKSDNTRLSDQMKVGTTQSLAGPLKLVNDIKLKVGDLAIVSNCETGDLFQVTAVSDNGKTISHAASGNISGNLKFAYGSEDTRSQTTVMKFMSNIYYVGNTGLTNENNDVITALYQQSLPFESDNPPIELIQGVENMRVAFGIRDSGGSMHYLPPDVTGFDPTRVESIQIGLLMNSWDQVSQSNDSNTYTLAGQPIYSATASSGSNVTTHAGDKRYRLAFNTTIKIRNRRSR
ncbi:MAG: PilW family protein [Granulosicoccus sp.]